MAIGHVEEMAALARFSYKKMYGCFARTNESGCNNKVTALTG